MVKRVVWGLVVGVLLTGVTGCGGGNEPKTDNTAKLQERPLPAKPGSDKPGAGGSVVP